MRRSLEDLKPEEIGQIKDLALHRLRKLSGTVSYRGACRRRLLANLHPEQLRAYQRATSGERYFALCCGRRAGKTYWMATLILILLLKLEFGQEIVYVAPTLKRGKELIWAELMRLIDHFMLGYRTLEHQGMIVTSSKGMLRIVGLDNRKHIGRIARGGNMRALLADEVQEYPGLLGLLLEAASPALGQTRGLFVACGTPGYVRRGYWHDICHGKDGFETMSWTMFQNPFLGRPAEDIVAEEIVKKGWHAQHPTLLREYYGKWVDDASRMVFELCDEDTIDDDDEYDVSRWRHVIGVDYGHSPDPCAWVVLAAHPNKNKVIAVHAEKQHRLTSDQICARTDELRQQFRARRIVGDAASGGKTFIADFNLRHGKKAGFFMVPADKADRDASIQLVNTELRTGRLKLLREEAGPLIAEMQELQWDEDHKKFLPGDDHCADSLRYALRALHAYLAKPLAEQKSEEEQELELVRRRNERAVREQTSYAD